MARERENLPVEVRPYRVGLTLSGGGAKGFAHVGALKAMEELGVRPDIISGTSAGAVIAVLYADGYSPDEILDLFSGLSFNDLAEITLPRSCFFSRKRSSTVGTASPCLNAIVESAFGSQPICITFRPFSASATATFDTVVDLPIPPFPYTAILIILFLLSCSHK